MRQFNRPPDECDDLDLPRTLRALEAERLVQDVRLIRQWERDGGDVDIDYDVWTELKAWRAKNV